jgi:hypothetical protein
MSAVDEKRCPHAQSDRLSVEFVGASTADLVDALAQRLELLAPGHLLDAWAAGTARYWRRRAETFEAARPTRGEFHGRATPEEANARWERLTATAQACRNRAAYAEQFGVTDDDLALIAAVTQSPAVDS